MFTVAAPLLLLIANLITEAFGWYHRLTRPAAGSAVAHLVSPGVMLAMTGVALLAAGQLALVAAVLLRLRRVALVVIAVSAVYWILGYGAHGNSPTEMFYLTFSVLEVAALITSPGPRRGLQLLTWKRCIVVAAAAIPVGVFWIFALAVPHRAAGQIALAAIAAIATGMAISSRLGRYLVALFAMMLYPSAVQFGGSAGLFRLIPDPLLGWPTLTYLPLYVPSLLTACLLLAAAALRSSDHGGVAPGRGRLPGGAKGTRTPDPLLAKIVGVHGFVFRPELEKQKDSCR